MKTETPVEKNLYFSVPFFLAAHVVIVISGNIFNKLQSTGKINCYRLISFSKGKCTLH